MQVAEKAGRIFDIPARIKHGLHRAEILAVEVLVDLHASDIDQDCPPFTRPLEGSQCLLQTVEKVSLALDIHCIGSKTSLAPCLCQAHGIEDSFGNAIFGRCGADGALTGSEAGLRLRCKADQGERRDRR